MKKCVLIAIIILIITALFIMPPVSNRLFFEKENKGFTAAVDISSFGNKILPDGYKESGATAVYVRNISDVKKAAGNGLPIALEVYPDGENYETLYSLFSEYNIKYIVLRESETPFLKSFDLSRVIEDFKPVLVLKENIGQNGNETPSDFRKHFELSNGRVVRAYETLEKSVISDKSYDAVYYQMLNSACERNTRFIIVNQLTDSESYEDNIERTQRSVKKFSDKMKELGYNEKDEPDQSGYFYEPSKTVYAAGALIACLFLLISFILIGFDEKKYIIAASFVSVFSFGITYVMPKIIILLYPTLFAISASVFLIVSVKKLSEKFGAFTVFTCVLILSAFTGLVLSSMLSGTKYYNCINAFYGVKIALLAAPLFAVYLIVKENGINSLKECAKKNKWAVLAFAVLIFIYLIRSGNTAISETERIIRNYLTEISVARPRTKEFLIGWPCLYLYIYATKKEGNILLQFVFLIGAAILLSSIVNTFCHVFTDMSMMYLRVVNGLIFSLPVILVLHFSLRLLNLRKC